MHEVTIRARPHHRRVPAQVFRHVGHRHHGAIDDVPGDAGFVTNQLLAHDRLHTIAADDGVGFERATVTQSDRRVVFTHMHVFDVRTGEKLNVAVGFYGIKDAVVEVGAVSHGVRIAEARTECFAHRNGCHFTAIDRIHHHHTIREYGAATHRLADSERIERGERVGPELQAGADFTNLGGLLQERHRHPEACQRQRCRHAADAAADDERRRAIVCAHFKLPSPWWRRAC